MVDDNKLVAESRTTFGKGARSSHPRHRQDSGRHLRSRHRPAARHPAEPRGSLILRKANAVLDLDINGKSQLALVKDVQKDPVRQIIEHIDLVIVRKGEKVTIDIPVHLEGEAEPGTQVLQDANTLSIEAEATNIPERLTVSIEGLGEGTHIVASQVELPEGSTLISDPDARRRDHGRSAADLGESEETPAEGEAAADRGRRRGPRMLPPKKSRRVVGSVRSGICSGSRQWKQTSGLWSGSVIPGPATPEIATTSATWSSANWHPVCRRPSRVRAATRWSRKVGWDQYSTASVSCWPSR